MCRASAHAGESGGPRRGSRPSSGERASPLLNEESRVGRPPQPRGFWVPIVAQRVGPRPGRWLPSTAYPDVGGPPDVQELSCPLPGGPV